eukprot:3315523-Prymnesium_polylepis.1
MKWYMPNCDNRWNPCRHTPQEWRPNGHRSPTESRLACAVVEEDLVVVGAETDALDRLALGGAASRCRFLVPRVWNSASGLRNNAYTVF